MEAMVVKMSTRHDLNPHQICPLFEKAVRILGKPWTGLILYSLLAGSRRFSQITAHIGPVSASVVSTRLKELEREGIVERRVFPETPVRIEYVPTAKAAGLKDIVLAIHRWADALGAEEDKIKQTVSTT